MSERYQLLRRYESNQRQVHTILRAKGFDVPEELIWQILRLHFDTGILYTEILFKELSVQKITVIAENFLTVHGRVGEVSSRLDFDIPLDEGLIEKATIKFSGMIWQIHKSDQDPFPSKPHAHEYEHGLKIHLGNGDIYRKKQVVNKMRTDDLLLFRQEIIRKMPDINLPKVST